jgi:hypothetical protein
MLENIKSWGVADLRYDKLNMQVIETSMYEASGASTDWFHTLIKQHLFLLEVCNDTTQSIMILPNQ